MESLHTHLAPLLRLVAPSHCAAMKISEIKHSSEYDVSAVMMPIGHDLFQIQVLISRVIPSTPNVTYLIAAAELDVELFDDEGEKINCKSENPEILIQISNAGGITNIATFQSKTPASLVIVSFKNQSQRLKLKEYANH